MDLKYRIVKLHHHEHKQLKHFRINLKHNNSNKLVIFHHDPGNDDSAMDIISKNVGMARPGSLVAMEGMELEV